MSTHGLSIVRSTSTLGKKAALSNSQEYIILGYFCLFSSFPLGSIEIKKKIVGLVHDVHKWPAALIDSQAEPSVKHHGPIVLTGRPSFVAIACEYPTCAREISVISHVHGYPKKITHADKKRRA